MSTQSVFGIAALCVVSILIGVCAVFFGANSTPDQPLQKIADQRYRLTGVGYIHFVTIDGVRCVITGDAIDCDWPKERP